MRKVIQLLAKGNFGMLFLIGAVVFLVFYPVLIGGKIYFDEERIGGFYPLGFFYQLALESNESFLWNPYYYGGFPSYLNVFGGFLYPLHYALFTFFSVFTAYHLAITLAVFAGMIFSYLFGRRSGFSKVGSFIFAASYTMGQTFGAFATGLSYANGFLVLPMLFYALLLVKQARSVWIRLGAIILGGAGMGIGFLAGFPQTVLYAVTFAFFYALFLDSEGGRGLSFFGGIGFFKRYSATLSFFAMSLLAVFIGSPQLIPMLDLKEFSVRVHGYTASAASGLNPLELVTFILPDGINIPFLVHGTPGFYIGLLSLFFVVLAVLFVKSRVAWFFFSSYILTLLMAFQIPPFSWVNTSLPIFSRVSGPARWLMTGVFSLGYLAASGYDLFSARLGELKNKAKFRRFIRFAGFAALLIFLALVSAAVLIYFFSANAEFKKSALSFLLQGRELRQPYEHYADVFERAVETLASTFSFSSVVFLFTIFLFPAGFFVMYDFYRHGSRKRFAALVLIFAVVNYLLAAYLDTKDALIPASIINEEPIAARVMKERENGQGPFRFIPFLTGEVMFREIFSKRSILPLEQARMHRELLTNQVGTFYGLQNMAGFEPLKSKRADKLVDQTVAPHLLEKSVGFIKQVPLLSMMNVKYILSLVSLEDTRLLPIKIPQNSYVPIPIYLYKNLDALPRVYFSEHPIFWRRSEEELLTAVAGEKDFRKNTYIECRDCEDPALSLGDNKISVLWYGNGILELEADSESGGWLIFSESHLPGWIAEIDGRRVPIYTANYLFQAIKIPAGERRVKFRYVGSFQLFLQKLRGI